MGKKNKDKSKNSNNYPSAEFLQQVCHEDYIRLMNTYDKIYEKIDIALGFCGVILLVILGSLDYTYIISMRESQSILKIFLIHIYLACSIVSVVNIIWAVVQLLLLMRSKEVQVLDTISIRNEEIYSWNTENAAMWLIDKYTLLISEWRIRVNDRQEKYDSVVTKVIISVLLYAVVTVIEKGI